MDQVSPQLSQDLDTFRRDGFIIMRQVVPPARLAMIRQTVEAEYGWLEENDPEGLHFFVPALASPRHASFLLPLRPPLTDEDVMLAERPLTLTRAYLGQDAYLYVYEVNIAFASGTTDQQAHPDEPQDEQGPVALAWNLAITRSGPENGMTRIWAKTHVQDFEFGQTPDSRFEPLQPVLEPGDLLVRDLALVHQGVGNPSDTNRYIVNFNFKAARSSGIPEYRGEINKKVWGSLSDDQRQILRWHEVVDADVVHARPYPNLS